MVLPKPLSSRTGRPDLLAGALLALLCAGTATPAAADGLLTAGSTPPRSRLHVEIPGYTAYYVPPAAGTPAPVSAAATTSPAVEPRSGATGNATANAAEPGPLLAAAKAPVDDATAGLVLGYPAGSVGIPRTAETQLDALADRMRQDPTMIIALEGFAGGSDSLKARRLAMWRARAVRTRLIEDGIATQRIHLRAAEAEAGAPATERVDVRIVQP